MLARVHDIWQRVSVQVAPAPSKYWSIMLRVNKGGFCKLQMLLHRYRSGFWSQHHRQFQQNQHWTNAHDHDQLVKSSWTPAKQSNITFGLGGLSNSQNRSGLDSAQSQVAHELCTENRYSALLAWPISSVFLITTVHCYFHWFWHNFVFICLIMKCVPLPRVIV